MTTLRDLELDLDQDDFLFTQGAPALRPAMEEPARQAFRRARELVEPAIVYDWFPVGSSHHWKVEVGEVVFELGRHADLLEPASLAFLAVVTIGSGLDTKSRELQASGQALDSFMLDAAGVYAVGKLIKKAHAIVETDAAGRGWGVGAELAPGQLSGWAIAEQALVARLLDLDSIGVAVTDSGMLVPQKSASMMVGVGPGYESSEVHSPCEFCDLRETCRYRH